MGDIEGSATFSLDELAVIIEDLMRVADDLLAGGAGQCGAPGVGRATEARELTKAFSASAGCYAGLVDFLRDGEAAGLTHEELEARLDVEGRALICQLFQDHLDLRAMGETRASAVVDGRGVRHNAVEAGHHRPLETIFGGVVVTRLAYRAKGSENLHLHDAALNLPQQRHSHGLRGRCAIEATRGSYEEARSAIERATGQALGKRQVEELTRRGAEDVEDLYEKVDRGSAEVTDALVISADGKGIVMRPEALRPATRKAAASATHQLKTRLSKGEKRDRKRMAQLAVVYDCPPVTRTPAEVFARSEDDEKPPAPIARAKWCTASIVTDAREVIAKAFNEAERRDPGHLRPWVALVDGAKHQIEVIKTEARRRGVKLAIVCDFVHVLEYLWGAAWCFFDEGDPAAEAWIADKGIAVLSGKAGIVAGAIRRKATALGLDATRRRKADGVRELLEEQGSPSRLPDRARQGLAHCDRGPHPYRLARTIAVLGCTAPPCRSERFPLADDGRHSVA